MDAHHHNWNLARRFEDFEAQLAALRRRPAWPVPSGTGAGACDTVRFIIDSSPAPLTVVGQVLAVPNGFTGANVPAQFAGIGGTILINICDPLGCFFNEPEGELIGRTGWAKYMQPIQPNACQPSPYYPFEPEWEVFSLCCNTPACG